MRHLKAGRKLKRTSSHRKALLAALATALFEHKKIQTTEAKAKELRPFAEKLITKAKRAVLNEKQGVLPQGQTIDIHNRRQVYRFIRKKAVLQELFDTIAPMIEERPGGYTRIIKTGFRRGDGGKNAIIELVDWSAPQDGAIGIKGKKKKRPKQPKPVDQETPQVEETVVAEEDIQEVAEAQMEETEEPEVQAEETNEAEMAETEPETVEEETETVESEPEAKTDDEPEAEKDAKDEAQAEDTPEDSGEVKDEDKQAEDGKEEKEEK